MKTAYIIPQIEVSTISFCSTLCASADAGSGQKAPSLGFGGNDSDAGLIRINID